MNPIESDLNVIKHYRFAFEGVVMSLYEGHRRMAGVTVTVNGCLLDPRLDLHNHSPTGFEWGYCGSGPAQLSLAILAYHLRDDQRALTLYQRFKWEVIAELPRKYW